MTVLIVHLDIILRFSLLRPSSKYGKYFSCRLPFRYFLTSLKAECETRGFILKQTCYVSTAIDSIAYCRIQFIRTLNVVSIQQLSKTTIKNLMVTACIRIRVLYVVMSLLLPSYQNTFSMLKLFWYICQCFKVIFISLFRV